MVLKRCSVQGGWGEAEEAGAGNSGSGGGSDGSGRKGRKGQQQEGQTGGVPDSRSGCLAGAEDGGTLTLDSCTLVWLNSSHTRATDVSCVVAALQGGRAFVSRCELMAEKLDQCALPDGVRALHQGSVAISRSLLQGCTVDVEKKGSLTASKVVVRQNPHITDNEAGSSGWDAGGGKGALFSTGGTGRLSSCVFEGFETGVTVRGLAWPGLACQPPAPLCCDAAGASIALLACLLEL